MTPEPAGRWTPITYRGYWDFPRIFLVADGGQTYLFDCAFDEELEDYPDDFRVFLMPPLAEEELAGSWAELFQRATAELGRVPTSAVRFDPTRRKQIDAAVLDALLARPARTPG